MSNNSMFDENSDVQKTKHINDTAESFDKNSSNMSHKPKNKKSKKLKHILLAILIIFLAVGAVSSFQQNETSKAIKTTKKIKANKPKIYLSASECKNIAKNYVEDEFLSLTNIKEKMSVSKCAAKDSESAINYLDSTYDFSNVAVRKLRLLVEDDNTLTKENAKLKLEDFGFTDKEIKFALSHYSDTICSLKKHDLSCEIVKDSVFSKTNEDAKSKDSNENAESKSKSASSVNSANKNQANTNKTITKTNSTNKSSISTSNPESTESKDGNAEQQQENKQPSQATEQKQTPAPAPAPQQQSQQLPVVHPGSFCSTSGSQGVTIRGTLMMCKLGVNDDRLRWRKVR